MKKNTKAIVIIFILILGGVIAVGYFIRKNKHDKFRAEGVETTATIIDLTRKRVSTVSTKSKRMRKYYMKVRYFTQENKEKKSDGKEEKMITKDENGNYTMNFGKLKPKIGDFIMTGIQISSSQYNKYKKGQKVQVFYLPENPQEAILKEDIK